MSKSERWSSASSDSDVSFVLFGGSLARNLSPLTLVLLMALCIPFSFDTLYTLSSGHLDCSLRMDAVLSNSLRVSRSLGEQRGELQGSFAIHDILREKIAFLSGILL